MPQAVNIRTREPVVDYDPMLHNFENGGGGGGDNMLEARVAKLESDVENIKANLSEARADIRELTKLANVTNTNTVSILEKIVFIEEKISTKAGRDFLDTKIGELKVWILGLLLLSIAMPIITFLINLYLKKP